MLKCYCVYSSVGLCHVSPAALSTLGIIVKTMGSWHYPHSACYPAETVCGFLSALSVSWALCVDVCL